MCATKNILLLYDSIIHINAMNTPGGRGSGEVGGGEAF